MSTLEISAEAASDLAAAAAWYAHQLQGLDARLLRAYEDVLDRIAESPRLAPVVEDEDQLRRVALNRFPYGVFYTYDADDDHVVIVAVVHLRRDPEVWKRRT